MYITVKGEVRRMPRKMKKRWKKELAGDLGFESPSHRIRVMPFYENVGNSDRRFVYWQVWEVTR